GEMSMITGHPCSADVVATTPVLALVLPTQQFESLRSRHPEIEIALSQLVSDRLGHRSRDALCGKSLGGFRLERCLSSGAMGVVYRAIDEKDGSQRALKMMRHRFIYSPRVVSRFDQEADFLRQLEHANIVSMRGHFVAYRTRFIVLDLYDGSDLRRAIRRHGPMDESTTRRLLGQIAAGLAHAHENGVLHLDLKPANILINSDGHVAITDFGLGRLVEFDGVDREVVGTPLYMPPEQFTMRDVGPHCDWYSFGCLAYELMTGERLFESNDTKQLRLRKLRAPTQEWPEVRDLSDELRGHMQKALQPLHKNRTLDLMRIAQWAAPVPELATSS
ncbi:MAG: protein kinase domain-containing protein, partial [Rubripirellula sp.]